VERTKEGIKALHSMKKGQVQRLGKRNPAERAKLAASLFGIAARQKTG
jgi:hypothetical protein